MTLRWSDNGRSEESMKCMRSFRVSCMLEHRNNSIHNNFEKVRLLLLQVLVHYLIDIFVATTV